MPVRCGDDGASAKRQPMRPNRRRSSRLTSNRDLPFSLGRGDVPCHCDFCQTSGDPPQPTLPSFVAFPNCDRAHILRTVMVELRNKWLHRGPAHIVRDEWGHNFCSSANRSATKFTTNSSCPTGVPRILMPRGFQTSGPRSAKSVGQFTCEIGVHPDASAFPKCLFPTNHR